RGEPGLVTHVVLTVIHRFDAKRSTIARDPGRDHQADGLVLEDGLWALGELCLRVCLGVAGYQVGLGRVEADQLRPCLEQAIRLAVDMGVVKTNRGESRHRSSLPPRR